MQIHKISQSCVQIWKMLHLREIGAPASWRREPVEVETWFWDLGPLFQALKKASKGLVPGPRPGPGPGPVAFFALSSKCL